MFLKLGCARGDAWTCAKNRRLELQAAAHFPLRERDGSICRKKAQQPPDKRPTQFLQDKRLL
jgi:hypothetical protein